MKVSKLDMEKFEWNEISLIGKSPEFKFGCGYSVDDKDHIAYIFGGFSLNKQEN